ncbi:MAG: hypothetical protein L0Y36_05330 [Planctomycetales bacterium]|nr:hypothetical protein [Planctomycetales bacterium]
MSEKNGVVIFGIGPISKTIFYACQKSGVCNICGFAADRRYIRDETFCGLPVTAFEEIERLYPPRQFDMLVVNVGAVAGTLSRKDMFLRAKNKRYHLINYIDARAEVVDGAVHGENNIIMSNTHIGPSGRMGDNNFIRENLYLGHDFILGSHNFLGVGCIFGGACRIGDLNFIGLGATVLNDIEIKNANLIGAGSVVIRPIDSGGKYAGNPAKRIGDYIQPGATA